MKKPSEIALESQHITAYPGQRGSALRARTD
jgi:hypothetical protein